MDDDIEYPKLGVTKTAAHSPLPVCPEIQKAYPINAAESDTQRVQENIPRYGLNAQRTNSPAHPGRADFSHLSE